MASAMLSHYFVDHSKHKEPKYRKLALSGSDDCQLSEWPSDLVRNPLWRNRKLSKRISISSRCNTSETITTDIDSETHSSIDTRVSNVISNYADFMDFKNAKNYLKLIGNPVIEVINKLNQGDFSEDMFDEVELIIFSYLDHKYYSNFMASSVGRRYHQLMAMKEKTVDEDDFEMLRKLGRGGFGYVYCCKRIHTGKLFAMKVLNKKRIKLKKAELLCLEEIKVFGLMKGSKYIVNLKYAFTTYDDICLVLEFMAGGDLAHHISLNGHFSLQQTQYFAASILMGLSTLHEHNIILRDLKPSNCLLDLNGRLKITDFGLATILGKIIVLHPFISDCVNVFCIIVLLCDHFT